MLQAAFDESEDEGVLILGGYVAAADEWVRFSPRWDEAMRKYNHGEPLKASTMAREWSEPLQSEGIGYCYDLITDHTQLGAALAVDPTVLDRVMADHREPRFRDPYFFSFYKLIPDVLSHPAVGDEEIEFVFDSGNEKRKDLLSAWEAFTADAPDHLRQRLRGVKFRSDAEWPPIQAADLKAWSARKTFNYRHRGASKPQDFRRTRPDKREVAGMSPYYDEGRLLELKAIAMGGVVLTDDPPGFEIHSGGFVARAGFRHPRTPTT